MAAQLSGMRYTPNGNAVQIAAVGAKVHFIVPHLLTVHIGANGPGNGMGIIHIDPAEVLKFGKRLEHGALFEIGPHVIKPLFPIVKVVKGIIPGIPSNALSNFLLSQYEKENGGAGEGRLHF